MQNIMVRVAIIFKNAKTQIQPTFIVYFYLVPILCQKKFNWPLQEAKTKKC